MPRLSESEAWQHYRRLALEALERPALAADYVHCCAMARAWRVWFDLFSGLDGA